MILRVLRKGIVVSVLGLGLWSNVASADLVSPPPPAPPPAESRAKLPGVQLLTEPIALLAGIPNFEVNVPISRSWALAPSLFYASESAGLIGFSVFGMGLKGDYHFGRRVDESSWFLGLGADLVHVEMSILGLGVSSWGVTPDIGVGYQWVGRRLITRLGVGYSLITPGVALSLGLQF